MTYDSEAEQAAAEATILALGYRKAGKFEFIDAPLLDAEGNAFNAVLDFIPLAPDDCTIEFKTTGLNSRKSKPLAETALAKALASGFGNRYKHKQDYSWSNSAYKHGEQHAKLPALRHITTFTKWPSHREIKLYLKLGILFCHLSALKALNSACRMAREGFEINFQQVTPDGQQFTFPLNSMYRLQMGSAAKRNPNKHATGTGWPVEKAPPSAWKNSRIDLKR
ncbi:hypothetical protein D0T25_06970 [Duganella sp. BJB488]|uniref:hypothetical protein n=1 Tax=unclassified Duganella TaxID=2636909 RepID=UPI000E3406CE|nr:MULTISPECIES: hypothetical protein [unclassified Duganella]RFP23130.1 hypothetical protein D0T26_08880 [Duganella sp. BJB489]RFP24796.1 hypothetical protein D0T25_06970 [Duganella sp. BJB488]RFP34128.1 hypothetical protein D0T24_17260 [Duganella sp. BJB480]